MTFFTRQRRIECLGFLTTCYFLVEIIVGHMANSISLVADSFHMISDVIALYVAWYAIQLGRRSQYRPTLTYGWQRAEILGALVNGVFLLGLCFTIFVQAIQRFIEPHPIENPQLVLIVGGIGLFVNIVGLMLFHEHGHHHHDGDHHQQDDHSFTAHVRHDSSPVDGNSALPARARLKVIRTANKLKERERTASQQSLDHHSITLPEPAPAPAAPKQSLNMRGVFLHVLGDALGSVGVVCSALVTMYVPDHPTWTIYVDPIISIFICGILVSTSVPLVRSAMFILLQNAPAYLPLDVIKSEILSLPGVVGIHEFHVWQLSDNKVIGSVHVLVDHLRMEQLPAESCNSHTPLLDPAANIEDIVDSIHTLLHGYGVHNTTVQPEFIHTKLKSEASQVEIDDETDFETCRQRCVSVQCAEDACCPPPSASPTGPKAPRK